MNDERSSDRSAEGDVDSTPSPEQPNFSWLAKLFYRSFALFGVIALLLGVVYGPYVLYEKVYLAIQEGQTAQRGGVYLRDQQPKLFWGSVINNGVMGVLVSAFCGLVLWALIRSMMRERTENQSRSGYA